MNNELIEKKNKNVWSISFVRFNKFFDTLLSTEVFISFLENFLDVLCVFLN